MFDLATPWIATGQVPSLSSRVCSNLHPLSQWCHPIITSSVAPFSSSPQSFPASGLYPMSRPASGSQSIGALASILPMIFRLIFPSDWLAWSPCSPRDSQESSPAPQFKSICSLMLSFLYGLTLMSVHDYWENHNFDCMDLCWQSAVSAF